MRSPPRASTARSKRSTAPSKSAKSSGRSSPRNGIPRRRRRSATSAATARMSAPMAVGYALYRSSGRPYPSRRPMWTLLRRRTLTQWIIAAMVVGVLIGGLFPQFGVSLSPISTVFLRMIKSIIVPLIFGTLVVGIAGHGDDMKRVGRLALKSIIYFEIVTTLALVIGLIAVNLIRPGDGVALAASAEAGKELAHNTQTGAGFLEHLVPTSFFDAAAKNEVLQVVFFAVLFAVALSKVQGRSKEIVLASCEGLADVMFKFTLIVMRFAPIGIGAAIAVTVAQGGLGVLVNLGKLILTLYGALIVF